MKSDVNSTASLSTENDVATVSLVATTRSPTEYGGSIR